MATKWAEYKRKQREKAKLEASAAEKRQDQRDPLKYPIKEAWDIAVERSERAKAYAAKFPHLIHRKDLCFQEIDWQYENEGVPTVKKSRVTL